MRITLAAISILTFGAVLPVSAQSATQVVHFQVDAINRIGVSGTPSLMVSMSTPGSAPTSAVSSANSFAVTTNQTDAKITASLSAPMPSGLTLSVDLGAPPGALTTGMQPLGTTPVDLVTSITKVHASGLSLTYQLDAAPDAGVVSDDTRVVTYTITAGA
jgi:hypothetical protein